VGLGCHVLVLAFPLELEPLAVALVKRHSVAAPRHDSRHSTTLRYGIPNSLAARRFPSFKSLKTHKLRCISISAPPKGPSPHWYNTKS
jgi:hypothetical protein